MTEETMANALSDGILEIPHYYCRDKTMRETAEDIKKMAVMAMKKQISKKPKQRTVKEGIITTNYECPVCGCRRLGHGYNLDKCYCPECGQKLDWSD